mmetsp:Transcript_445/g.664  ORF Transcript_445/g.664 Transcript_445/m.664 type:complete len:214 (+) Transcript_445:235-876(+)
MPSAFALVAFCKPPLPKELTRTKSSKSFPIESEKDTWLVFLVLVEISLNSSSPDSSPSSTESSYSNLVKPRTTELSFSSSSSSSSSSSTCVFRSSKSKAPPAFVFRFACNAFASATSSSPRIPTLISKSMTSKCVCSLFPFMLLILFMSFKKSILIPNPPPATSREEPPLSILDLNDPFAMFFATVSKAPCHSAAIRGANTSPAVGLSTVSPK